MSYILEALKKSEKERQRGTVPNVLTSQDVILQERKRRLLWPYVLVGALMVNAGMLAWWLAGHPNKPAVSSRPVAVQQSEGKMPVKAAGFSDALPSFSERPKAEQSGAVEGETSKSETRTPEASVPPESGVRKNKPLPGKAIYQNTGKAGHAPTPDAKEARETPAPPLPPLPGDHLAAESADHFVPQPNRVYNLRELPNSIQQTLPDFAISTHLYSADGASRVVRINGQMLREGQYMTAGLKLEEITPDGVIFDYRAYRFRIGLR